MIDSKTAAEIKGFVERRVAAGRRRFDIHDEIHIEFNIPGNEDAGAETWEIITSVMGPMK